MPQSFGNETIYSVVQVTQQKKLLRKNQQVFNKLSARIASLSKQIEIDGQRLIKLNGLYNKAILPLLRALGEEKIVLAKALAAVYRTMQSIEQLS
ncbi:MAG: hypothetical protein ABIU63_03690 [Chitinophagaceae bacterium]